MISLFNNMSEGDLKKPRLTGGEKKKYHKLHGRVCDVTGKRLKKSKAQIHHIEPVFDGGSKNLENLATLSNYPHEKIHKYSQILGKSPRNPYSEPEWVKRLTDDAMVFGKLARVHSGECPQEVYRRELLIEEQIGELEG